MTAVNGPKVVSDGLVFAFDMSNTEKSWKGRPTVNLASSGYSSNASQISLSDVPERKQLENLVDTIVDPRRLQVPSDGSSWLDLYSINGVDLPSNSSVLLSLYAYIPDSKPVNKFNANGNFGATLGTNAALSSLVNVTNIETGVWKRLSWSNTNTTESPITVNTLRAEAYRPIDWSNNNTDVYVSNFQVETRSDNIYETPYVQGTRGSNSSILDLTLKSTGTINSLTYDSDGTFTFNNENEDRVVFNHHADILIGTEFSFEFWINPESTQNNSYPYVLYKGSFLMHINQNPVNSYVAMNVSASAGLRQTVASSIVNPNIWNHVIGTYDGQVGRIYYNGELKSTSDFGSVSSITASTGDLYVGGSNSTGRAFNGKIAELRQYNRALTADEVLNNYEASKNKYI